MTIHEIGNEYFFASMHANGGLVRGLGKTPEEARKRCWQLASGRATPARQTKD
jgi:hypothetical protein